MTTGVEVVGVIMVVGVEGMLGPAVAAADHHLFHRLKTAKHVRVVMVPRVQNITEVALVEGGRVAAVAEVGCL
jgi:hypothetical protein